MRKVIIAVLICTGFGMFMIYRPVKNQKSYVIAYSTMQAKGFSYTKKNNAKQLSDEAKGTGAGGDNDKITTNDGSTSSKAQQAIEFCKSKLGHPYLWGGTGVDSEDRYDCSGLMQAAYKSVGVTIGRSTYNQVLNGDYVDPSDMSKWKPGDLVLPHAGHVVMYIGDGKCIHSPQAGEVVKITEGYNPSKRKIYAVRRIVND